MYSVHDIQDSNSKVQMENSSQESSNQVINPNVFQAIKTQFQFKVRAQFGVFTTLIIVQLIAILFSFGESSVGMGMDNVYIHSAGYSGNIFIFLTIAWAGIVGYRITLTEAKDMMFTFVTNHRTNHIANMMMIIFISIVGGISAYLLAFIFKMAMYVWRGTDMLLFAEKPFIMPFLTGMMATILYMLLVASLAYFIGEIIQFHKIFIVILPISIIGMFIISVNYGYMEWFANILPFYLFEKNFLIFMVKIIVTSVIALLLAMLINDRQEVRKS